MASHVDNQNFFGDRLRLSAFLRVVQHVPQLPSRCRRRAPTTCGEETHVQEQSQKHMQIQIEDPKSQNNSQQIEDQNPQDNSQQIESRFQDEDEENDQPNTQDQSLTAPTEEKTIVYTCKAAVPKSRRGRARKLRKAHPVDELMLVHNVTEDHSDDRSSEDTPPPPCITDIDPIEDSQMLQNHQVKSLKPRHRVQKPKHRTSVSQRPGPLTKFDWKATQTPSQKARVVSQTTIADGFIGSELLIPPQLKQKRPVRKRRATRQLVTVPRSVLAVVTGNIPPPSQPSKRRNKPPVLSLQLISSRQLSMDRQLETQLSLISAPRRHETDSEEDEDLHEDPIEDISDEDLDDDPIEDLSDEDLDEDPNVDPIEDTSDKDPADDADQGREELIEDLHDQDQNSDQRGSNSFSSDTHFQNAFYGSGSGDEDAHFWSQYNGMD